ncbi:MAG: response regulator [Bdellovibrionota bacterium]
MKAESRSLLIVDDEPLLCEALAFAFKRAGFEAFTSSGGDDAFSFLEKRKVDFVLSDMNMPGGSGYDLLLRVKERFPDLPFGIFISCVGAISLAEAYNSGADSVFSKPFSSRFVVETVQRILADRLTAPAQRRQRREGADINVHVHFQRSDVRGALKASDLGRGGFFVLMETKDARIPQVGESVSFQMLLGDGAPEIVRGVGAVRWVRARQEGNLMPGCGVEFTSFDGQGREVLLEYANFLSATTYIPKTCRSLEGG